MATINLYLKKENLITHKSEIAIRFSGGRGKNLTQRLSTNIFIHKNRWDSEKAQIIIPRKSTNEKKEIVEIDNKLNDLSRVLLNKFDKEDKNTITKQWFLDIISHFHNPIQQNITNDNPKVLEYIHSFIKEAPNRIRQNDGVKIKPNAIQQYKATEKHLKNYTLEKGKSDFEFQEVNEEFYKGFVNFLQVLNFRQNTVGKHIRVFKSMINGAPLPLRKECDLSKFKVFNVDVDNVYLTEDELTILWETNLSDKPAIEAARDWFLIACWTGSRYSDLNKFIDIVIISVKVSHHFGKVSHLQKLGGFVCKYTNLFDIFLSQRFSLEFKAMS